MSFIKWADKGGAMHILGNGSKDKNRVFSIENGAYGWQATYGYLNKKGENIEQYEIGCYKSSGIAKQACEEHNRQLDEPKKPKFKTRNKNN